MRKPSVTCDLGSGVPDIGTVGDQKGDSGHSMIVHNLGWGPRMDNVLLSWKVIGHYRYYALSL